MRIVPAGAPTPTTFTGPRTRLQLMIAESRTHATNCARAARDVCTSRIGARSYTTFTGAAQRKGAKPSAPSRAVSTCARRMIITTTSGKIACTCAARRIHATKPAARPSVIRRVTAIVHSHTLARATERVNWVSSLSLSRHKMSAECELYFALSSPKSFDSIRCARTRRSSPML